MAKFQAAAAFFFALFLPTERAEAEEDREPIAIVYTAPPSCPAKEALLAHVSARTSRARGAAAGEPAREFRVDIEKQVGAFKGTLLVPGNDGAPMQRREVTSAACADLVEAVGFFIALAVDARADTAASSPPPSPPPAPLPIAEPAPERIPEPPSPIAPTPPTPELPVNDSSAPPPARRAPESRLHVGIGAGSALVSGVASRVALGSRLMAIIALDPSEESFFAPALSISAVTTTTVTDTTPRGGLALRWSALEGIICPVALVARSVALRPCALAEWGVLRGDGVAIPHAQRNDAPWFALGAVGRAELPLGFGVYFDVEAGVAAPLVRPRFDYTSGAAAFTTPAVGARAGVALAVRF